MTNQEVKEYLKENLTVLIDRELNYDYDSTHTTYEVKLMLEGDVISETYFEVKN